MREGFLLRHQGNYRLLLGLPGLAHHLLDHLLLSHLLLGHIGLDHHPLLDQL